MFLQLLIIETRKLLKHPIFWVELGALMLTLTAYFTIRYAVIAEAVRNGLVNTRGLELDLQVGLGLLGMVGLLFYAATAALLSAQDYPDRSIQMWLTRGVPRPLLLLTRLTLILALGFLLVAFVFAATLGLAALTRSAFLGGFSAENLDWAQIFPSIMRIFAAAIPYLALTVLLGVVSRSPLFAAGGALVFGTVLEKLLDSLSNRFPTLIQFTPAHLAQVLQFSTYRLDRTAQPMILGGAYLSEPQALLTIGLLLLALSAISLVIFSRQDLGG